MNENYPSVKLIQSDHKKLYNIVVTKSFVSRFLEISIVHLLPYAKYFEHSRLVSTAGWLDRKPNAKLTIFQRQKLREFCQNV